MATKLAELLKKLSIKPKDWSSDSTDIVKWAPEAEINNPEVAIVIKQTTEPVINIQLPETIMDIDQSESDEENYGESSSSDSDTEIKEDGDEDEDEDEDIEEPGSDMIETPLIVGICTLTNVGNTCFMNSCLQLLWQIDDLRKYLIDVTKEEIDGLVGLAENDIRTDDGFPVDEFISNKPELRDVLATIIKCFRPELYKECIKALSVLFKEFNKKQSSTENTNSINIAKLKVGRTSIYSIFSKFITTKVKNYKKSQEDAGEMIKILEAFECFINNPKIYDIFKSFIVIEKSNITCSNSVISTTNSFSTTLQLKIVKKCKSVSDLIKYFTGEETDFDEGNNKIDRCKDGSVIVKKQLSIDPPESSKYLILELIRFEKNGGVLEKNEQSIKIDKIIKFGIKRYIIQGCVSHEGANMGSGHYVYIVFDKNGRMIKRVSDDTSSDINRDFSVNDTASILLYKRIDDDIEGSDNPNPVKPDAKQTRTNKQKPRSKTKTRKSGTEGQVRGDILVTKSVTPPKILEKPSKPGKTTRTKKPPKVKTGTIKIKIKPSDAEKKIRVGVDEDTIEKNTIYSLNNRKSFPAAITNFFEELKIDDSINAEFSVMPHQQIVVDYLNTYSPYRGLLLYHGLGSGKTCASIAVAERLKQNKQIIVMTPASLSTNYREELKKCGDKLFNKNTQWKFIKSTEDLAPYNTTLSAEFIEKKGGLWVSDDTSTPYSKLSETKKKSVNDQITEMINTQYKFIHYNGLNKKIWGIMTSDGTINPFDDKVIIIDEAHNLVSRISNKIKNKDALPSLIYKCLKTAKNSKIVLLTGTPIVNYPNEIGIMFNILRGNIQSWKFTLTVKDASKPTQKITEDTFIQTQGSGGELVQIVKVETNVVADGKKREIILMRNPFGFINEINKGNKLHPYLGVKSDKLGEVTDADFIKKVESIFNTLNYVSDAALIESNTLPDTAAAFNTMFINEQTGEVKDMALFKKRSVGLVSYFRSAQESRMPLYDKKLNFKVEEIPMSNDQFNIYEEARQAERKLERSRASKQGAKKGDAEPEISSTYRIFSRAYCNFVFPKGLVRPKPKSDKTIGVEDDDEMMDEDILEGGTEKETLEEMEDGKKLDKKTKDIKKKHRDEYMAEINTALKTLTAEGTDYLSKDNLATYSPKFLRILENVTNEENRGSCLIYSQFRTLEGIGILKLVFEANGFVQFKITKTGSVWNIDPSVFSDPSKQKFILYTGTEEQEEKEILRNVFNGDWEFVPPKIKAALEIEKNRLDKERKSGTEADILSVKHNNLYGDIVKIMMITSSGAEGISLKNVRFVHITEPYWHPVRVEQVIGRARRIDSHKDLPKMDQTVNVYLYLMTISKEQELKMNAKDGDSSKLKKDTVFSTDQTLYEISNIKEKVNLAILSAVEEASVDCHIYAKDKEDAKKCLTFNGRDLNDKLSFAPNIENEEKTENVIDVTVRLRRIEGQSGYGYTDEGIVYKLPKNSKGVPIIVGKIKELPGGKIEIVFD